MSAAVFIGIVLSIWWIVKAMSWKPSFRGYVDYANYAKGSMLFMGILTIWLGVCFYHLFVR